MFYKQRLESSDAVAEEIEELCEAMEVVSREAKEPLGFMAHVSGGGEKGT